MNLGVPAWLWGLIGASAVLAGSWLAIQGLDARRAADQLAALATHQEQYFAETDSYLPREQVEAEYAGDFWWRLHEYEVNDAAWRAEYVSRTGKRARRARGNWSNP